ncbi:MAG: hypothetical protein LBF42_00120 [Puniceicoccales bacterium]|jgi:RNA polymerase-binding transcription factor DksA|nr:hypothetical protein [Puniceicoccales bacterium]
MDKIAQNHSLTGRRTKAQNSMAFTLEDVRQIIRQKTEQAEIEEKDSQKEVIEVKHDIVAPKSTTPQKIGAASIADILGFNPNISKQTETRDKDPSEVPMKYRKYYKLLLKLKSDAKQGLSRLTKEHLSRGTGSVNDLDVETFDSGFALSLMSSEQEAIAEIEKAIQRIHNGTYGICELTGRPIEAERLAVVPFTRFSKQGQEEQERTKVTKERTTLSLFEAEQSDGGNEFSDYEEE